MLNEVLSGERIQFGKSVKHWEDAIELAAEPLVDKGFIDTGYVDAMIQGIKKYGPYVVIAPHVAIPHARPENGVHQIGMSMLILKNSVAFSEKAEHRVKLIIVLAAIDNDTHLKALSQLTKLLSDQNNIKSLENAVSVKKVMEIVDQFSHK